MGLGKASEEEVTIVQPGDNQSMDERFSSILREEGPNACDVAQLEATRLGERLNVREEGERGVESDTQATELGDRGDDCIVDRDREVGWRGEFSWGEDDKFSFSNVEFQKAGGHPGRYSGETVGHPREERR